MDARRWLFALGLVVLGPALASCATLPRAPASSCMQRTLDSLDLAFLSDDRKHCLASGTIALRCGRASALIAGYGKEVADLFGPGQVQRQDLHANSAGRRCAGLPVDEGGLPSCCAAAGF